MPARCSAVLTCFLAIFVTFASSLSAQSSGKVVCFGDSITKGGYPGVLAEMLRVEVVNAGVGGHTSSEGLRRMSADVLGHHPDLVVVLFGTNDIRVDNAKKHVLPKKYQSNLEAMIAACQKQGAKIVLCTLPPISSEPFFKRHDRKVFEAEGGLARLVKTHRDVAVQVATQQDVPLVDLYALLLNDPNWMSSDGVHPSKQGETIIARHIANVIGPLLKGKP